MISVQNARVVIEGREILHGISFEIPAHTIGGYVGPNGAGKTTTLRLLTGTLVPDEGLVLVGGVDVVRDPLGAKRRFGYVPEAGFLYESFTPIEYLSFVGRMYGLRERTVRQRTAGLLRFWNLTEHASRKMTGFSKGMKQKVLISAALLHDPAVLLFDEPINGLDAEAVLLFRSLLKTLAGRGKTILYSSHILDAVEKIVDTVVVIQSGRILAQSSPQDLMAITAAPSLEIAFSNLTSTENVQAKTEQLMLEAFAG